MFVAILSGMGQTRARKLLCLQQLFSIGDRIVAFLGLNDISSSKSWIYIKANVCTDGVYLLIK